MYELVRKIIKKAFENTTSEIKQEGRNIYRNIKEKKVGRFRVEFLPEVNVGCHVRWIEGGVEKKLTIVYVGSHFYSWVWDGIKCELIINLSGVENEMLKKTFEPFFD